MTAQIIDLYNAKMQRWARKLHDARIEEESRRAVEQSLLQVYAAAIADAGEPPLRVSWRRIGARHWELVEVDNPHSVWACVEPYGDGVRRGRGMFAQPTAKAFCMRPDMPSRHGGQHWSLASTVAMAKRDIVGYICRHPNAPDIEIV
jgi:hypothetical protein